MTMYDSLREKIKPNLGTVDRTVRYLIALALMAVVMFVAMREWYSAIPLVLAIYLLITGNLAFCPFYRIFKWSTVKIDKPD
jgi:hypothetical protein